MPVDQIGNDEEDDDAYSEVMRSQWETVSAHAESIAQNPRHTIRPDLGTSHSAAEALGRFDELIEQRVGTGRSLTLGDEIGRGGMGVVRMADQIALGREVAVKSIRADKRSDAATVRLIREAWLTGAVEHPNVVPVHDMQVDDDGAPLIVLKRIAGVRWGDVMHDSEQIRERFAAEDPLEWNLRIFKSVCNAVEFAHSRGIVHRDLKPENVMIGLFGEVYVLDWGLAVSLEEDEEGRLPLARDAIGIVGTPAYMAPEMLTGTAGQLTAQTDVYLLGATLWEMVSGAPPHKCDSVRELFRSVLDDARVIPDDVAPELARVIARAMARDCAERYQSAADLRTAVERFLQHRVSDQLATDALARFHELGQRLDAGDQPPSRNEIYELFGECRFGFLHARTLWSESPEAKAGLRAAVVRMVEYELGRGDASAAAALLVELEDAPVDLRARVHEARADADGEAERMRKLERLGHDLDPAVGQRARMLFGLSVATLWCVAPIVGAIRINLRGGSMRPWELILWPSIFLAFLGLVGYGARRVLFQSAINRRLFGSFVFAMSAMLLFHLGMLHLGFSPALCQVLDFFLWFCVGAAVTTFVDRRFAVATVGYLLGFLAAAERPDLRFFFIFAANFVLTLNIYWLWRSGELEDVEPKKAEIE